MKNLIFILIFTLLSCAPRAGFVVRRNIVMPDRTIEPHDRVTAQEIEPLIRLTPTRTLRPGAPPAILDSALILRSARNIETYMRARGFYDARLDWAVQTHGRRATVIYSLTQGEPWRIGNITYDIRDSLPIDPRLGLKTGDVFDVEKLDSERRRITTDLRDRGHYKFTVSNIEFIADTARLLHVADLRVVVADPAGVFTVDTVEFDQNGGKLRRRTLRRTIAMRPHELYNATEHDQTYQRIMRLGYFRSAVINFEEFSPNRLSAQVKATPVALHAIRTDLEGSFSSNFSAIGATLGYQNRNLLRGAELFDVSLTGRYEFLRSVSQKKGSHEIGGGASLTLPRLLTPVRWRADDPRTRFEFSVNYQSRPIYRRTLSSARLAYSWRRGKSSYIYRPVDLNIIDVREIDPVFLENLRNPYLRSSYLSQLVPGTSFSWVRTSRLTTRFSVETAGNLFSLTSFDVRFSRYVRAEASVAGAIPLGERTALAWRGLLGGATSYGHAATNPIPIDRLFYSGGSNSMRGWVVRRLGPGTLTNDAKSYPSQVGNLKLEANMEFRFPVWDIVNGAVFLDAGNIWLAGRRDYEEAAMNDDAMFRLGSFYRQLGLNTGLGARLDLRRFLLRVDWGIRLHDPALAPHHRWIGNFHLRNTALNFGVGYPF